MRTSQFWYLMARVDIHGGRNEEYVGWLLLLYVGREERVKKVVEGVVECRMQKERIQHIRKQCPSGSDAFIGRCNPKSIIREGIGYEESA